MSDVRRGALIVEDEPTVQAAIAFALADSFDVTAAGNAAEAFALLDRLDRLDVVLVDICMPGLRGVEFASMLADLRPDLAVVVMSGLARPREGELPDRVPFLRKPFFPDELSEAIVQACLGRDRETIRPVPAD